MEQNQDNELIPEDREENNTSDLIPITRIGVETELSRYPIHNMAKKGRVNIRILKKTRSGEVDLKWEVSYNDLYGPARSLAYKLDTIVINRRIDEVGRPVPKIIRLGSLREIADMLDLGTNTAKVRQALRQNVGALISAKIHYRTNQGTEQTLEADFSRYSVIFTGEKLPEGNPADAVYIILNAPYQEVLNNAPIRPLNYEYLKALPPAPQRFYEIISSRIYAALKNKNPFARILYSEYCTYAAQQRYFDYDHFKKQMYKVHLPHIKSGYIAKVRYENATDAEGREDWMMCYSPGGRARAEYMTFARKSKQIEAKFEVQEELQSEAPGAEVPDIKEFRTAPTEKTSPPKDPLLLEMTKRGISENRARKLRAGLQEGQQAIDQLEWGDHLIQSQPGKYKNTAGFYIYLLTENISPPPSFETSRQRKVRQEASAAAEAEQLQRMELEEEYEAYRNQQVEEFIQLQVSQAELAEISERKRQHLAATYKSFRLMPAETTKLMVWGAVKGEIKPRVRFLSFEDFIRQKLRQKESQPSLFEVPPAPVGESREAAGPVEPETTMATAAPKPQRKPAISPQPDISAPPAANAPYRANLSVTEGAGSGGAEKQPPAEQGSEALGADEATLLERYREFQRKEAQRALDRLGMLERGRRMKTARAYLLSEHPNHEHYQHLIAEGEYEQFHKVSEDHLLQVTLKELRLPNFEDWKRYALSAISGK
jgi:hypothetical protein